MYFFSSSHIGEHCTGTIFTIVADRQCFDAGPDPTYKFFMASESGLQQQQGFLCIFKEILTANRTIFKYEFAKIMCTVVCHKVGSGLESGKIMRIRVDTDPQYWFKQYFIQDAV
jgi:hypothetical protein